MSTAADDAVRGRTATLRERADALEARARRFPAPLWTLAGLGFLVLVTLYLRTQALSAKLWIDEGLSIGIAHHDLLDIPTVLQQDGSPPLYYMLLHVWMAVVDGDGEARTHALSVVFAVLTVPVGFLAGRAIFGARAGWATAALFATCPFLTYYAQETRMYALVVLLSVIVAGAFALAYALRRRAAIPVFGVALALLFYTHNWGLFLGVGLAAAFVLLWRLEPASGRRALLRDGVLGFGLTAVLYAPWVPTLLQQARETGAPWSATPRLEDILNALQNLVGGTETALTLFLLGVAGLLGLRARREEAPRARAALALGVAMVVGILVAWVASQISPAWTLRYFAAFLGPALLLAGAGLVRHGKLGLIALAIILALWFDPRERSIRGKSDVWRVAQNLRDGGYVAPGDLVVSTQPEQVPLLRYYLGPDLRYADALGPVPDTGIFDWRDAEDRLLAAGPVRTLRRIAPSVAPGQRLILVLPIIRTARWGAPWTSLVRRRSFQWERAVSRDGRFERVAPVPKFRLRNLPRGVRAVVYERR